MPKRILLHINDVIEIYTENNRPDARDYPEGTCLYIEDNHSKYRVKINIGEYSFWSSHLEPERLKKLQMIVLIAS